MLSSGVQQAGEALGPAFSTASSARSVRASGAERSCVAVPRTRGIDQRIVLRPEEFAWRPTATVLRPKRIRAWSSRYAPPGETVVLALVRNTLNSAACGHIATTNT